MLPVIVLAGRPNVGKSTLFNRLTRSRSALVADQPGLTRDRQYGIGRVGSRPYVVVDTGGIGDDPDPLASLTADQSRQAIREADAVLFLVDGREGLTAADQRLAEELRRLGKPVLLTVNKAEHRDPDVIASEFHALGIGEPYAISAAHGDGATRVVGAALEFAPEPEADETEEASLAPGIRVAVVGRPNVGKSTLVNRLLGEERVMVYDRPGTTRDSVYIPFERAGEQYTLIDTAGVRRRSRVQEAVEKFSAIKTLQAIEAASVVILVLDASEGVTEQDARLAGQVVDSGRALVVGVNKWDGLSPDQRDLMRAQLDRRLPFLRFARWHYISALHGSGVGNLFDSVTHAYTAAMRNLPTPLLTRILQEAVSAHAPPLIRGRRIKLRYAHQGGRNPPRIVIHGNQVAQVPDTYQRYLVNTFRDALDLSGTPVQVEFHAGRNPYDKRRSR